MTHTVAVVTAGLSQPSSTRLLADQLAAATERGLRLDRLDGPGARLDGPGARLDGPGDGASEDVRVEVVEVRELAHQLVDAVLTGFPSGALADAVHLVRDADAVIAVSPIFDASYSGLFKMFFDVLEEGALTGTPVLLGATAGTARHSLALEFAMRPLFAYLRADVVPTAVFAASEDFGSSADSLTARVERAGRELADAVRRTHRANQSDPFADPTPFEQLLAAAS